MAPASGFKSICRHAGRAVLGSLVATGLLLAGLFAAAPANAAKQVRCESPSFRDNYCAVETHGSVRLSHQISRAPCRQGSTWGYDRHGIWVTEGCIAEFEVAANGDSGGR